MDSLGLVIGGVLTGRGLVPDYMSVKFLATDDTNGDSGVTGWHEVFPKREVANDATSVSNLVDSPAKREDGRKCTTTALAN